ncbi:MAG: bacillithiol biosynthesis cysteine-adding enzyme BshC [Acidobacteriota bacterium]|nr:bacillithiol biosynthesis cysteine-adding enzyme BshC [Acidobacteriota bacterium]
MSTKPASPTEAPAPHLAVDIRQLPGTRPLAADYAYQFDRLAPFFAGNPAVPQSCAAVVERTLKHPRARAALAALLAAQQQRRGAPAAAVERARQFADPRSVAIVTGQQAGLFGGPLYTLLKALTAIQLAEQIARQQGVPAIPVFWVESEDHDWDEVRSCTVLDAELEPHTLALPTLAKNDPVPVATVPLPAEVGPVVETLAATLPATEFTPALLDDLRQAYVPGRGMAEAFATWLEHVLGRLGLVVYDASDPAAKPLVADLFRREIETPGETARLAAAAGADLVAHGYHAQVQAHEDSPALFYLDGTRRPIRGQQGTLVVGETPYEPAALAALAAQAPAHFSPNVLLRPLVEDTIFPTACYVAGPNELAYLGQLRGVYERYGIPMPLMHPRATATLLDSAAVRFMTRYQVGLESLQAQDESALNRLLEAQLPPHVEASIDEATRTVTAQMERVIEVLPVVDPTLAGAARSTLGRMQHDLKTLHNKLIQAAKRRDETLRRQFMHARRQAFPGGHAQERTVGFVYFLNQYGPALVDRLRETLPLDMGRHWILTV